MEPGAHANPKRRLLASCIIVGGIALVVGLAFLLYGSRGHSALDRELALAHKEGIATTYAELAPNPPVTDAENAAPFYVKAIELARPYQAEIEWVRGRRTPIDFRNLAQKSKFDQVYAHLQPAINALVEGADHPRCDFHDTYITGGSDPAFRRASALYHIVDVVAAKAKSLALFGKPIAGLDFIRSVAPVVSHFMDYRRATLAYLEIGIFFAELTEALADIMSTNGREAGVPEAATAALKALGPDPDALRLVNSELARELSWMRPAQFKDLLASYRMSGGYGAIFRDSLIPGMMDRWKAVEVQFTRDMVAKTRADGDNLQQLVADTKAIEARFTSRSGMDYEYAKVVHGLFSRSRIVSMVASDISRRRTIAQGSAILDVWNRTGKLPVSLPLTGLAAHDPQTGAPLHYVHTKRGFKVYSSTGNIGWFSREFSYPAKP